MSRVSSYPPGAPCFVGVICPDDGEPAKAFYTALFGWDYENIAGPDDPPFFLATLAGDRVATLAGSGNGEPGAWITAVAVADREAAADAVNAVGGSAPEGATVEIADVGRFHRVHDPAGGEVHLVQVEGRVAERRDEPGCWSTSRLLVDDPSRVVPFYDTVFDWRAERQGTATTFHLPTAEASEITAVLQPLAVVATAWVPDFRVDDVDTAIAAALAHGGAVADRPDGPVAGLAAVVLTDPGGASFSVSALPG